MDTVTITTGEAIRLYRTIQAVADVKASVRFTYACGRTKRALQPLMESFDAAQQAQHAKYLEAAEAHAERDAQDQPVRIDEDGRTGFRIDAAKREAFEAAAKALNDELAALVNESVAVEVHRIPIDVVPDLTGAQVDGLWPMLQVDG